MLQGIFPNAIPRQVVDYYAAYGLDEEKVKELYGPVKLRCGTPAAGTEERSATGVDRVIQAPCLGAAEVPSQSGSAAQGDEGAAREGSVPEEPGEPEHVAGVPATGNAGPWATGDGAVEAAAEE